MPTRITSFLSKIKRIKHIYSLFHLYTFQYIIVQNENFDVIYFTGYQCHHLTTIASEA